MAGSSGLFLANKGGTAVNPVPFLGSGVFYFYKVSSLKSKVQS